MKPHPTRSAVYSIRLLVVITVMMAITIPLILKASPPSWWATRGATDATKQANDYAVVNQGQLKQIATQAMLEMDGGLPNGAGPYVHALVDPWATPTAQSNDFAPVNLGMLKTVAKPFYDQLISVGYPTSYPWAGSAAPANDYAAANIGQVKNVFSFDLSLDSINGELPNWWELKYFGHTGVDPNALSPGSSGLTNLQDYQLGLNPTVSSTAGDAFTDGWKVARNLNSHDKVLQDTSGTILGLQVFTPLQ